MKFVYSDKCTEYYSPGHPETPNRVKGIYDFLTLKGEKFIVPQPCSEEDVLLVHTLDLLHNVREGQFIDPDTPALPNIYEYARLAVGGAIIASEVLGFSIMRPPGHHAGKNYLGGFCYFNNIAIAIKKYLCRHEESSCRAAILDIDCHHGNGTENIFSGDTQVLYVSLHRYGFFYPGTGDKSYANIKNYPLNYGISEIEYITTLKSAKSEIKKFNPSVLGVSVGFDTYKLDPVGGLGLEIESYAKIGELIRNLNLPTFYILEGGYSPNIAQCLGQLIGFIE